MNVFRRIKRDKCVKNLWSHHVKNLSVALQSSYSQDDFEYVYVMDVGLKSIDYLCGEDLKPVMRDFCKYFSDSELKFLQKLFDGHGVDYNRENSCIMLPCCVDVKTSRGHSKYSPLFLACRLWRWVDLVDTKGLCCLPYICKGRIRRPLQGPDGDNLLLSYDGKQFEELECCNPFHWSRKIELSVIKSPVPQHMQMQEKSLHDKLPGYSDTHIAFGDKKESIVEEKNIAISSTETGISRLRAGQLSVATDDGSTMWNCRGKCYTNPILSQTSFPSQHHWCVLHYWEKKQRRGRDHFQVVDSYLHVLLGTPTDNQRDFALAAQENLSDDKETTRLRQQFGLGYVLIYDEPRGEVLIYSRSDLPLFVSSTYIQAMLRNSGETRTSIKLKKGFLVKAYDVNFRAENSTECLKNVPKVDFNSIRVSLGKGWGPGYTRQDVTECNCWTDICLDNLQRKAPR